MGAWFVSHVLGGLITSLIMAGLVAVSHLKLWRKIRALTERQTADLKEQQQGR